jgi:hypothetical protein
MMMLNQTDGIAVGDFVIRPVASENTGYNSNVLGVSGSGSGVAQTSASVRVNSNWPRASASLSYGFSHSTANGNSAVTATTNTTDTSSGSFTSDVTMVASNTIFDDVYT